MKIKSTKQRSYGQRILGLCMGLCILSPAQANDPINHNVTDNNLQRLQTHVQSLNELTERRRISTLYKNEQSITRGLQHNHVNVGLGNATFTRRDMVIKSRVPTIIARVYDSSLQSGGDFGQGWQLTLNETITAQPDGTLSYIDDSASQIKLVPTQTGFTLAMGQISDIKNVAVLTEKSLLIDYQTGWQKTFVLMGDSYRLTKINDAYGNSNSLTYANQKLSKITGQNGHFVDITRDEQGRIIAVTDDHQRKVSYQYNKKNQLSAVTDLGSNVWQYDYQGKGLLKKITDPEGNTAAAFSYGEKSRVTSAQVRNAKHRYNYVKHQTTVTDQNKNTTTFVQNSDGITYEVTNAQGIVSAIELNKNNQVTKLGHDGLLTAEFTFDDKSRASRLKRRTQDGSFEQLTYQYDNQNRLIGISNNNTLTAQSVFNEQGQPIRIVADGIERTYGYAANGDVISQTEGDINRAFEYSTDGLLTSLTENSQKATFSYSKTGKMTSITFPNGNSHQYEYDALGFRTKTQRSDNSAIEYSYDRTGNLLGLRNTSINGDTVQKDIVVDVNHLTNQFIVNGNQTLDITYSDSGNPTTVVYNGKTVNYEYDRQNRLIAVDEGDGDNQKLTHQYQDGENGLRIQLDDRSSQINNPARKTSQSAIGVNSLYTRGKGTQWKHVMYNEQLGRIMMVNDKGFIPGDVNFKSSFQRRRLYNATATSKRNQRSYDKPSSSEYQPVEYFSSNCEAQFCGMMGVTLYAPNDAETYTKVDVSAVGLIPDIQDCEPLYSFFVNESHVVTNTSGDLDLTFYQKGDFKIDVAALCGYCKHVGVYQESRTISVVLDEIDRIRQEYIDQPTNTTPARDEFVNNGTFVNPGHFAFNEINAGTYNYAVFTIANHLENIRTTLNTALIVNSGYRNPVHNLAIGGANNSLHIYGLAADIAVVDFDGDGVIENGPGGQDTVMLDNAAIAQGATRTIIYATHIHMDWR